MAEPFACGGSAATFASCVIHPMDLAKVCMKKCVRHCATRRRVIVIDGPM